jgi:hypothetical protein
MARDVISTCPVCEGELLITRLHCRSCGTAIEGEFGVGRFGRLSREQLALLESFLRARGNLKELERELGISYPTVRGRVDALVRALGLGDGEMPDDFAEEELDGAEQATEPTEATDSADEELAGQRRAILERLSRGEVDAAAAAAELRALTED